MCSTFQKRMDWQLELDIIIFALLFPFQIDSKQPRSLTCIAYVTRYDYGRAYRNLLRFPVS